MKILMILNVPWCKELGAARVQLELAEEFVAAGHQVDKFDWLDAFPKRFRYPSLEPVRDFPRAANAFVQNRRGEYDIIDALEGNLTLRKEEFRYSGLLVSRSVGLSYVYAEYLRFQESRWPQRSPWWRKILQAYLEARKRSQVSASFEAADLVNVPNLEEKIYCEENLCCKGKTIVLPFGLSTDRFSAFRQQAQSTAARLMKPTIAFIGNWDARKGSKDWNEIIRRIVSQVPQVQFHFLGTVYGEEVIFKDLDVAWRSRIRISPKFESTKLPELLGPATVGVFPSYIEGFGFAVLEQLAAGLPTVTYDVPGPREMLRNTQPGWLVPKGNTAALSQAVVELLSMDVDQYSEKSELAGQIARRFRWDEIARSTMSIYQEKLSQIRGGRLEPVI